MVQYSGQVKSFNAQKGWGFIECEETQNLYGKDVFLLQSALPRGVDVQPGDDVTFKVVQGNAGVQAASVEFRATRKVGTIPKGRVVGGGSSVVGSAGRQDAAFIGVVKSWNDSKGWGFVTSDAVVKLYGKDVLFRRDSCDAPVCPGQQVSFGVVPGTKGVMAVHVQPFGIIAGPARHAVLHPNMGNGHVHAVSPMPMPMTMGKKIKPGERLYGCVRSYNAEKGWGFVDCPSASEAFHKDVFLLKSAVAGMSVGPGTLISFKIVMGQKGPQATELQEIPEGSFTMRGELPGCVYEGVIKSYNVEKGWGFVASDDAEEIFAKDIFVHKREFDSPPSVGEDVQFSIEVGPNGQLEAKLTREGMQDCIEDAAEEDLDEQDLDHSRPIRKAPTRARASPY